MEASLIVPAGGFSRRFGCDKSLASLFGRPLILHTLDGVEGLCHETFVVISDRRMKPLFEGILLGRAKVLIDHGRSGGPLAGILRGLEESREELALVLACDLPFVSRKVVSLMLRLANEKGIDGLIPRWPNGFIEPLHAVYRIGAFRAAVERSVAKGRSRVSDAIAELGKVSFLETEGLRRLDPGLLTFFNVNTREDLGRAEEILRYRQKEL